MVEEEYLPIGSEKDDRNKRGYAPVVAELEALYSKTTKNIKKTEAKETSPAVELKQESAPVEPPKTVEQQPVTEQPQVIPQQQQPTFTGIDDYIAKSGEAVKVQWINNAYQNLFAVFEGRAVIQPVQPQSQQPQQAQPKEVVKDNAEEIEWLRQRIVDPKTDKATKRLLYERKLKLEGKTPVEPEQPIIMPKPDVKGKGDVSTKTAIVLFLGAFGLTALIFIFALHLY